MSQKVNYRDNVVMESFFSRLKVELTYAENYKIADEARTGIFRYIKIFHNRARHHSAIANVCSHVFEQQSEQLTVSIIRG